MLGKDRDKNKKERKARTKTTPHSLLSNTRFASIFRGRKNEKA